MRLERSRLLLVNMAGEFILLSDTEFNNLIYYELENKSELYKNLHAKHFICKSQSDTAIDLLAIKYRTKKDFLSHFTSLHMFVVTQRCNQKCTYCQVSSQSENGSFYEMNIETAKKAVDMTLSSPSKYIKIEFQGGEPLINFETVKYIVEYANQEALKKNKNIEFVICTNLTTITDDMIKYISDKSIFISTSLDGPQPIHDHNRNYRNEKGTYKDVIDGLNRVKEKLSQQYISALMTTTRYSLDYPKEIVDEYVQNGLNSIFLRPLNPFGYAIEKINLLGYSPYEFITFYKRALDYIIKLNIEGIFLEEYFTTILLTRILTPFSTGFVDLQFPAGTGIMGVIYAHDGKVYPSDEARMLAQVGDNTFCIGDIRTDSYRDIFYNYNMQKIIDSSIAEVLPGCSDCAFQIYCGIDPIRNYATQKDIIGNRTTNESCYINKEIIKYLFSAISEGDRDKMDVFWSWITNRKLSDIKSGQ